MATPQIPDIEPIEITIGETETWTRRVLDYPASDGWALTYYFRGGDPGVDVTAIQDPNDSSGYKATMTAAQSATLIAGRYDWQAWVSRGSGLTLERHQVASGYLTAKVGFVSVDADVSYDGRSEVKKTLDAIRAAIGKRATDAQLRRSVGNTQIEFMSMTELMVAETRFQQFYNQEVRRARAARGESAFRIVRTRFVPPT